MAAPGGRPFHKANTIKLEQLTLGCDPDVPVCRLGDGAGGAAEEPVSRPPRHVCILRYSFVRINRGGVCGEKHEQPERNKPRRIHRYGFCQHKLGRESKAS
ncbi:MAG: hypothetical protein ACJ71Q_11350 [Terriglobales bacterium]